MMVTILVATALLCVSLPVAFVTALVMNDRDARRADLGVEAIRQP
jgi:hypothetical protein